MSRRGMDILVKWTSETADVKLGTYRHMSYVVTQRMDNPAPNLDLEEIGAR